VVVNTEKRVHGILSEYIAQPGVQCYKDLAGNLKQVHYIYTAECCSWVNCFFFC